MSQSQSQQWNIDDDDMLKVARGKAAVMGKPVKKVVKSKSKPPTPALAYINLEAEEVNDVEGDEDDEDEREESDNEAGNGSDSAEDEEDEDADEEDVDEEDVAEEEPAPKKKKTVNNFKKTVLNKCFNVNRNDFLFPIP